MDSKISTIHKTLGIAALIIFILTGLYLRFNIPHIDIANEKLRMMFRANHIYIMFAAALNIGLGSYLCLNSRQWRKIFQLIGSALIMLATLALITAFFLEPARGSLQRPITGYSLFAVFLGAVLHLLGGAKLIKRS
jgi:hypothetical protein